jgi:dipeptidase E
VRLLLFSNSRNGDDPWLAHAIAPLRALLGEARTVAFVPFAGVTIGWDEYAGGVAEALAPLAVTVRGVHDAADPRSVVADADAVLVGGGNTFHLLAHLHRTGLVETIARRVRAGMPYAGWSAGAVVAGPTLGTTNDMPIVAPPTFDALALVDFQINAHFTDAHPPGHRGETRRERLAEYVTVHPRRAVVGLPEGDWLEATDGAVTLRGPHPAFVFRAGEPAAELAPDHRADPLLGSAAGPAADQRREK